MIRLYAAEKVPDHIMQEVEDLINKLGIKLGEACAGHDHNIILSAFNRFHAGMICAMVTEEGLIEAAKTEAIGLLKNIQNMSGQEICKGM